MFLVLFCTVTVMLSVLFCCFLYSYYNVFSTFLLFSVQFLTYCNVFGTFLLFSVQFLTYCNVFGNFLLLSVLFCCLRYFSVVLCTFLLLSVQLLTICNILKAFFFVFGTVAVIFSAVFGVFMDQNLESILFNLTDFTFPVWI